MGKYQSLGKLLEDINISWKKKVNILVWYRLGCLLNKSPGWRWMHTHTHAHIYTYASTQAKTLIQSLLQGFADFSPQNEIPQIPGPSAQHKTRRVISCRDQTRRQPEECVCDIRAAHPEDKADKNEMSLKQGRARKFYLTCALFKMCVLATAYIAIQTFLQQTIEPVDRIITASCGSRAATTLAQTIHGTSHAKKKKCSVVILGGVGVGGSLLFQWPYHALWYFSFSLTWL